jgi:hypothetical protein
MVEFGLPFHEISAMELADVTFWAEELAAYFEAGRE